MCMIHGFRVQGPNTTGAEGFTVTRAAAIVVYPPQRYVTHSTSRPDGLGMIVPPPSHRAIGFVMSLVVLFDPKYNK